MIFKKKNENQTSDEINNNSLCLKCKKIEIEFECDPCGHASFCRNCAMKLASGGKCKTCGEFYGGLRRCRLS